MSDNSESFEDKYYNSNRTIHKLWKDIDEINQKLQAAEENLAECGHKYWKEVEKRKAAEERIGELELQIEYMNQGQGLTHKILSDNKTLLEAVESIANLEQVSKGLDASVWYAKTAIKARQALEKVKRGGE